MARPKLQPLAKSDIGKFNLPSYSIRELAHRMGLHVDTVRSHCREGRCPAQYVGGSKGYVISEAQRREYAATFKRRTEPKTLVAAR